MSNSPSSLSEIIINKIGTLVIIRTRIVYTSKRFQTPQLTCILFLWEELFTPFMKNDVLEVKKVGFSKVAVFLKTGHAANELIVHSTLKAKDYVAFILPFCTTRKGIIRDVPLDVTEEDIIMGSNSPFKIILAKRFNRRITDSSSNNNNNPRYVPSKSVSTSFEGQFEVA